MNTKRKGNRGELHDSRLDDVLFNPGDILGWFKVITAEGVAGLQVHSRLQIAHVVIAFLIFVDNGKVAVAIYSNGESDGNIHSINYFPTNNNGYVSKAGCICDKECHNDLLFNNTPSDAKLFNYNDNNLISNIITHLNKYNLISGEIFVPEGEQREMELTFQPQGGGALALQFPGTGAKLEKQHYYIKFDIYIMMIL